MTLRTLGSESVRLLSPANGKPLVLAMAMAVGVMLYLLGGLLMARSQPTEVTVNAIAVVTAPAGVLGRTLEVHMVVPEAKNCSRSSQQFLYQDFAGRRYYYPIGSALDGTGFAGSRFDFVLVLSLPDTLKEGDYRFVQRSAYVCSWFGGFLSRRMADQTTDRIVHLSASPGA